MTNKNLPYIITGVVVVPAIAYLLFFMRNDSIDSNNPFFEGVFTDQYKTPVSEYITLSSLSLLTVKYINVIGPSTALQCLSMMHDVSLFNHFECYNCLGWAAWEKEWLALPAVGYYSEDKMISSIKSFFNLHSERFKGFSLGEKKFPKFINVNCDEHLQNMIAFYFRCHTASDGQGGYTVCHWQHAARYFDYVDIDNQKREVDQWTSKLGMSHLISHKEWNDVSSAYGAKVICFAPEEVM